jgi:hypothetical protein
METLATSKVQGIENAGQIITREYADYLINGFKRRFPSEKSVVFISNETISKAIEGIKDITGIRFMYGFESIDKDGIKVLSRTIILVPCAGSLNNNDADSVVLPQGYITHTGKNVSFEKTKQLMYNHSIKFSKYFPNIEFNSIVRGGFVGINTLLSILETENSVGINFNFGYDDVIQDYQAKNKIVLEAIDASGFWIEVFDQIPICPPVCGMVNIFDIDNV